MKLFVAGEDKTAEMVPGIAEAAEKRAAIKKAPRFLPPHLTALLLRDAENTSDYLDKLVKLLWHRNGVSTLPFWMPARPGLLGSIARFVRLRLWLLFRYQHDRIAFQQNTINSQIASAVEFLKEDHDAEISELKARIAELERKAGPGS